MLLAPLLRIAEPRKTPASVVEQNIDPLLLAFDLFQGTSQAVIISEIRRLINTEPSVLNGFLNFHIIRWKV
ncbi:hypothetical protein D3C81_1541540 [compost metagenome]